MIADRHFYLLAVPRAPGCCHDMVACLRCPPGGAAGWALENPTTGWWASQQVEIPSLLTRACYSLFLPIAIPPYYLEHACASLIGQGAFLACKNDS